MARLRRSRNGPRRRQASPTPQGSSAAAHTAAHAIIDDYLTLVDDSAVAILPHAIRVAVELGLADLLADRSLAPEELAELAGAHPQALARLMRALETVGLFERSGNAYRLTVAGARLRARSGRSLHFSLLNVDSPRSWLSPAAAVTSGQPSFDLDRRRGFFEDKQADQTAARMFMRRMRERARHLYGSMAGEVDWSRSRRVVDIGANDGALLIDVLHRVPHLSGVLFDRPDVIDALKSDDEFRPPPDLAHRLDLVGGDFFDSIPVGADTHIVCSVLHDWTDDQAGQILANSRAAIADSGRLLVVEMVVPEDDSWHPSKWSDLGMMILTGGRERTAAEFDALLRSAGFELRTSVPLAGSPFSVLEARPVGIPVEAGHHSARSASGR